MNKAETTQYSEIEHKYKADHVLRGDFNAWALKLPNVKRVLSIFGTDDYYRLNGNVLRHRHDSTHSELTVKCRKSSNSTTNRVEVDLQIGSETSVADVAEFLKFSGWLPEVSLYKTADIFYVEVGRHLVTVVIYDIFEVLDGRRSKKMSRFIEVEVEKSSITQKKALVILEEWHKKLTAKFGLAVPVNKSLYELYTGNRYRLWKE